MEIIDDHAQGSSSVKNISKTFQHTGFYKKCWTSKHFLNILREILQVAPLFSVPMVSIRIQALQMGQAKEINNNYT